MHTLEYSFYQGSIHPEQLNLILNQAPAGGRIKPFSTLSLPLPGLEAAHQLAELLNRYSLREEGAADISSCLQSRSDFEDWKKWARKLNRLTSPVSYPFYEIREGGERVFSSDPEPEKRFASQHKRNKVTLETPSHQEFGLYSCDFAFVIPEDGGEGHRVHLFAGGGGGLYGGSHALSARPASWLGCYPREEALEAALYLKKLNAEWGDTENARKRRLKSLFASRGMDWVEARLREAGFTPCQGKPPVFTSSGEVAPEEEYNNRLIIIPSGKLEDTPGYPLVSLLKKLLPLLSHPLRLTPRGNLRLHPADAAALSGEQFSVLRAAADSPLKTEALACRGFPLCKRGKARSSLILDEVTSRLRDMLGQCGLEREPLNFRISGCPNGCSRPLFAELALIGRTEHTYDLFAGGSAQGDRIALPVKKALRLEEWDEWLRPVLEQFAKDKKARPDLFFGDWIFSRLTPES